MAESGTPHHLRYVIALLLDFLYDETPRDMGGLFELFYELHVAAGTAPEAPRTRACLTSVPGGGKVATFAKKLLALMDKAA